MIYKDIYYPCKQENFLITIRMKKMTDYQPFTTNTITSLLLEFRRNLYH